MNAVSNRPDIVLLVPPRPAGFLQSNHSATEKMVRRCGTKHGSTPETGHSSRLLDVRCAEMARPWSASAQSRYRRRNTSRKPGGTPTKVLRPKVDLPVSREPSRK